MLLVSDDNDQYVINDERGDEWAAMGLLRERVEQAFWYDDEDADRAKKLVETEDADGALRFLLDRREHEYEWVEITEPRTFQ